ncbi:MAG: InlB B-repeat-containing protein, partial [Candidatus Aenigmatarchaeota archaeon]
VTMDQNRTITAHFGEGSSDEQVLTVEIEGQGLVEVDGQEVSDGWSETYQDGDLVQLEAVPDKNWTFDEWTGDMPLGEEGISINVTMDQNRTITAHFGEGSSDEHVLTVEVKGQGSIEVDGKEVSDGWSETYQDGTLVGLKAIPDENWTFDEWTGDVPTSEGGISINVTMDQNRTITALFDDVSSEEHVLTVEVEGQGAVEIDDQEVKLPYEKKYLEGTEVNLTAVPDEGWEFAEWTGIDNTGEKITIVMKEDKEIRAVFEEGPYFEVGIVDYDEQVYEGDELTIKYSVNNTGEAEGTQDIVLTIGDEEFTVEEDLTLEPGEEFETEFTWDLEEGDAGEYDIQIRSEDDEVSETLTVKEEGSEVSEDERGNDLLFWIIPVITVVVIALMLAIFLTRRMGKENHQRDD